MVYVVKNRDYGICLEVAAQDQPPAYNDDISFRSATTAFLGFLKSPTLLLPRSDPIYWLQYACRELLQ